MESPLKKCLMAFLLCHLFASVATACSLQKLPINDGPIYFALNGGTTISVSRWPPYQEKAQPLPLYLFLGVVEEIVVTEMRMIDGQLGMAQGWKVKVTKNLNSPKPAKTYEVFPLQMGPDCGLYGVTDIAQIIPLGTSVRVLAYSSDHVPQKPEESENTRLNVSIRNEGIFAKNGWDQKYRTTVDSEFNYSKVVGRKTAGDLFPAVEQEASEFIRFELFKDQARLAGTDSQKKRLKVLERLVHYPFPGVLAYRSTLRRYLKEERHIKRLDEAWTARFKKDE